MRVAFIVMLCKAAKGWKGVCICDCVMQAARAGWMGCTCGIWHHKTCSSKDGVRGTKELMCAHSWPEVQRNPRTGTQGMQWQRLQLCFWTPFSTNICFPLLDCVYMGLNTKYVVFKLGKHWSATSVSRFKLCDVMWRILLLFASSLAVGSLPYSKEHLLDYGVSAALCCIVPKAEAVMACPQGRAHDGLTSQEVGWMALVMFECLYCLLGADIIGTRKEIQCNRKSIFNLKYMKKLTIENIKNRDIVFPHHQSHTMYSM